MKQYCNALEYFDGFWNIDFKKTTGGSAGQQPTPVWQEVDDGQPDEQEQTGRKPLEQIWGLLDCGCWGLVIGGQHPIFGWHMDR
uniref:Uncharacterized protein n=1 Tax=Romanomermis culicivorax TaxID=13658 RepID=A0A915KKG1_ROMCU